MKINKNSRIRVDTKIMNEFGLQWWDRFNLKYTMRWEYGLEMTSYKNMSYYFKPTDTQKAMLFIIAYGHLIKSKAKHFKY
jgi:hypothetical protein